MSSRDPFRVPNARCGVRHHEVGVRCVRVPGHVGKCWGHWEFWRPEPGVRALMRVEWFADTVTGTFVAGATPGLLYLAAEERPSANRDVPPGVPTNLIIPLDWPPPSDDDSEC